MTGIDWEHLSIADGLRREGLQMHRAGFNFKVIVSRITGIVPVSPACKHSRASPHHEPAVFKHTLNHKRPCGRIQTKIMRTPPRTQRNVEYSGKGLSSRELHCVYVRQPRLEDHMKNLHDKRHEQKKRSSCSSIYIQDCAKKKSLSATRWRNAGQPAALRRERRIHAACACIARCFARGTAVCRSALC
jgi:hypothetical protein